MADLVRIDSETAPVPEVVSLLEDALERARRGELRAVGLVAHSRGRCDATSYALGEGTIATLVLACRRLELRLLAHGEDG